MMKQEELEMMAKLLDLDIEMTRIHNRLDWSGFRQWMILILLAAIFFVLIYMIT